MNIKENKGITLVALIITIIVLLILAVVVINTLGGEKILEHAETAQRGTEEASRIEGIKMAYILARGTGNIRDNLQEELNQILGENTAEAIIDSTTIAVKIDDIYYEIDNGGNVGEGKTIEKIIGAGDITRNGKFTGTQEKPFQIECIEDLVAFSKEVNTDTSTYTKFGNKYVVLTKDLDFNSIYSYSDFTAKYSFNETSNAYVKDNTSETTIKELCTTGQGFIPIGNKSTKYFGGIFYGDKQREIKNIYIKRSDNAGLFDNCSGAYGAIRIRNITIDGNITSTGSGLAAGFIGSVNKGYGVSLEKCINKASIKNTGTGSAVGLAAGPWSGRIWHDKELF